MTTNLNNLSSSWSASVLGATAKLKKTFSDLENNLHTDTIEDFNQLFDGADKFEAFTGAAEWDRHDVMNAVAAIKGYAEILREDLGPAHQSLDDVLADLLLCVDNSSHNQHTTIAPKDKPVTVAEPGFILAVDDLQQNRELAARYLSRSGHIVVTAENGEQALTTLAQSDVDVVLLDLVMPGMDGREVLQKIKEHPDWRATPVIMISGRQDMQGIIECIEAGADDYLFKPFNPVLLQARIKAGIERKRWHDREEQYRQQLERNEKFIRATFGRYLSDEIVADILERPEGLELGGVLCEVTIMMSDIRSFTTICEHLEPDQVVKLLNRYLGAMTDIIMAHQGTIDEFLGDAILAVFGAPQHRDDDADRAVRCALAMQAAMDEINDINEREGLPRISTGIALNTGSVIAGNIGSERRSKYGFVGHPMNVTARIEDHCGGDEILASDTTLAKLKGTYEFGRENELSVKGIDQLVVVQHIIREVECSS